MSKNKGFDGGSSSSRGHGFHPNFNTATNMHLMFEAPSKETILMEREVNMEPSSYVDLYSFKTDYDHHQANHQSNISKEHVDSRRLLVGKFPACNGQNQQYHLESTTTPYSNYSSQNFVTPSSSNHHHDRGLHCHTLGSSTAATSSMQSDFADFTSNIGYEKWRRKAEMVAHPLFEQLFSTHISCLQAGNPIRDQSRRIHAYIEHSRRLFAKYSTTTPLSNDHYYKNNQGGLGGDNSSATLGELHKFMSHFVPLFSSYKDRLQQFVRPHTNACWELEQRIQCLTDVPIDKLDTGATMSDDDDEDIDELIKDIEARLNDESLDGSKVMGIGPLFPTEMERSLVDRVSQGLKSELKEGGDPTKEKIRKVTGEYLFGLEILVDVSFQLAVSNGGRQGKAGAGNGLAVEADKQLVYKSEEKELAQ
ncbi:hypothetical protein Scep_008300 [Stephania cephalantha]|uniref:KNOX1 domain-containing protein n=1 Tax=Stephania cephalantha TaxID=152367 RepID=A0AAP0PLY2_9MAGN